MRPDDFTVQTILLILNKKLTNYAIYLAETMLNIEEFRTRFLFMYIEKPPFWDCCSSSFNNVSDIQIAQE